MADVLGGRVITLGSGTAGFVLSTQIKINKIRVTWSGASNGVLQLNQVDEAGNQGDLILYASTIGAASATNGWSTLTDEYNFDGQVFKGLWKTTMTGMSAELGVQIQLS